MWMQIVGKVALAQAPPINHSWGVAFQLTPRGLSTHLLPHGGRSFAIEFDFIEHHVVIRVSDGTTRSLALAQLQQAALNLEQAKLRLENATLVAPFDGTVAELNISIGQSVGAGQLQPAIVVADLSSFHINVGVDESSVGQLKVGQPVRITIDALPDQNLTGHVDRIAPTATNVGGIISYKVTITLDPTAALVRGGMSANVDIVTATHENVLIVPNWTIRIDRATGKTYVNVRRADKLEEVEIVTGLRNSNDSEVISGVNESDVLVVPQASGLQFGG